MTDDERRKLVEDVSRKLIGRLGPDLEFLKDNGIGVTIFAFTLEPLEPGAIAEARGPRAVVEPGALAYISTSNREDMLRSIKEWVAYQEAGLMTEPAGERAKS